MPTWVFGYGSLIWNPGFTPADQCLATLDGFRRSFCMSSIHHRGSEAEPGLVLALDTAEGHHCRGLALCIPEAEEAEVLEVLRERELVSSAYYETTVPLRLDDGRKVNALAYVVDRSHVQYCAALTLEAQAEIIARATGGRGPNRDYLWQTSDHLRELGIGDEELIDLSERVRYLVDRGFT
ncbi:gamma-glutamylcyclotransferase [Pseudooceanicola sp. C21-150M6]|uniref:gamma-glutamylcyclotransferase n=1 Tax=Pseudooceanicola sp. C21-150M6 TaxID=3434355 RepID=UPI003D7F7A56